jgi:hypothetical protein
LHDELSAISDVGIGLTRSFSISFAALSCTSGIAANPCTVYTSSELPGSAEVEALGRMMKR